MFYRLLSLQQSLESLYRALVSLLRVALRSKTGSGPAALRCSGDITILANGPSLRSDLELHADYFRDKNLMCVNQFALTDDFLRLQPAYYILMDIGFFTGRTLPRVAEVREQVKAALISRTAWPLTLFCPYEARRSSFCRDIAASGAPIRFVYMNRTVADGTRCIRHWLYRRQWAVPPPQNVLIGALMAALAAGFRKITLFGADHSWHLGLEIDEEGNLVSAEHHFYDPKPWKVRVEHPETLRRTTIDEYFLNLHRTFRSYRLIREYADSIGAEIINASSVTYIDAFTRKKPEV